MRTFASEIAKHQTKFTTELLLNVEIVGLYVRILIVLRNRARGNGAAGHGKCISKTQGRTCGRCKIDGESVGRVGSQTRDNSSNGLIVHDRVSATDQGSPIFENVPGETQTRLKIA